MEAQAEKEALPSRQMPPKWDPLSSTPKTTDGTASEKNIAQDIPFVNGERATRNTASRQRTRRGRHTELVKRALGNAIRGRENLKGQVFHSDRGCQYSSQGYRQMLEAHCIVSSMSRPGCPYDSSCAESFFATIKKECIYRRRYVTMEEVRRDMFSYVELFYNLKRMHSFLGYLSPVAYRRTNQGGEAA